MVCVQGPCPIADHSHVPAYFLTDFSRLTHVETFCLTDSAISFSQGLTCSNAKALTLTANSLKPSSTEHSSQVCVSVCVSVCVTPRFQEGSSTISFHHEQWAQAHRKYLRQRSCSKIGEAEIDRLRVPASSTMTLMAHSAAGCFPGSPGLLHRFVFLR